MEKYRLTPEHKAELKPWAEKWIANAMSTAPMGEADRAAMREAARGLYRAANLEPPPDHRIVFVPSPFVLRFAGGFAAAVWHLRKHGEAASAATESATRDAASHATEFATEDATRAATMDAMRAAARAATRDATWAATRAATDFATSAATEVASADATEDATMDATWAATWAATRAATWAATSAATWDAARAATMDATWDATRAATWAATEDATSHATEFATRAATWAATEDATSDATRAATWAAMQARDDADGRWYVGIDIPALISLSKLFTGGDFGLRCAYEAHRMWQGGNQWSASTAFLSFFRHVVKLPLDYSKWQHWEAATVHGGPRIVHPDFCMISDRPEVLLVDDRHRPHCETGPFCRWRDGSALYAVHGVSVPWWVVEHPERITVERIDREENAEVRRVMIERMGADRYIERSGAKPVHEDRCGALYRREVPGDEPIVMVRVVNSTPEPDGTNRVYWLRVPPETRTALEGVAWTFGLTPAEYAPLVET